MLSMEARDRTFPTETTTIVKSAVILEATLRQPDATVQRTVIQLVRRLAHELVTHEVDEWFHAGGRRLFNPHATPEPPAHERA